MDISHVRTAVIEERYEVCHHAEQERLNDNLLIKDIENAVITEEIIEPYPNDPRGPSCLICGESTSGSPVHVVVGFLSNGLVPIITVYVPSPEYWETDWKTRKEGKIGETQLR